MNIESATKLSFCDTAMLAAVLVSCPCPSSLTLPIAAIVGDMTALPARASFADPVDRLPLSETGTIAEPSTGAGPSPRIPPFGSCYGLTAPSAGLRDPFSLPERTILTPHLLRSKCVCGLLALAELIPHELATTATIWSFGPGWSDILNFAAPLTDAFLSHPVVLIATLAGTILAATVIRVKVLLAMLAYLVHIWSIQRNAVDVKRCGSGTVGQVCRTLPNPRRFVGLDLSGEYLTNLALARSERKTPAAALATLPMFAERK